MDWLKQIAPTIATALGGPLAGMAVSAISKAIGVDEAKVGDLISNNKLTADQIAQVKLAEIELQKQAQELGLNFEKLEVEDRKSARDMQSATRSMMPPLLAGAVTFLKLHDHPALAVGIVNTPVDAAQADPIVIVNAAVPDVTRQ